MKTKLTVLLLLLVSSTYGSEFKLSTIKVKSDYNETSNSELGETIDAIDSKDIDEANATSVEDILNSVPGLNYSEGNNRPKYFQIRGVGERSLYEGAPNHSVGVMVDGINMSGMGSVGSLFGVEQVEVVKTSQATKFGANALAGVINYSTKTPSNDLSAKSELTYGNYNTVKAGALVSDQIGKSNHNYLFSLFMEQSDGYMTNSYYDDETTEGVEEYTLRFKLHSKWSEKTTSDLNSFFYYQKNGYDAWTHDGSRTTMSDNPGEDNQDVVGSSLKVTHQFDETMKVLSTTSYALSFEDDNYDEDWGNDVYWNALPGYNANYNYYKENLRKRYNLSEEIRLQTTSSNVGLYGQLFNEDTRTKSFKNNAERLAKRIESNFIRKTFSIFGDHTFTLSSNTILTVGARSEYYNYKYNTQAGENYRDNYTLLGANIKLENFPSESETRYINLSRGYKQGGVNTDGSLTEDKRFYDPEYMYGVEVGSKIEWSKNLYTTMALFGNYREDAQVKTTSQDNPMDPSDFTYYKGNAAKTYQLGAEGTFKSKISNKLEMNGAIALLRAKFIDYKYETIDKKGRDMAHAPKLHLTLKGNYHFSDRYEAIVEYMGKDSFYYSDTHDQKSHFYSLVNASLKINFVGGELSLWSKNIFNKEYATRGFYFENTPPSWDKQLYTQLGAPRTFGITIRSTF